MTQPRWTVKDLPWDQFDPQAVDRNLLALVKAAALVESNARDYTAYLCNVFADDRDFRDAADVWAAEEVNHGVALGAWAEKADPAWNYERALARFRAGYQVPVDLEKSVRGSRVGEMIARCIVETGTSSYYTAMADCCREPVLAKLCHNIAADELRHYKLFYTIARQYLREEPMGRLGRLKVALGRWVEAEDDELAYAFYAANAPEGAQYDHATYNRDYGRLAYGMYSRHHIDRAVAMMFKVCDLAPHGWLRRGVSAIAWRILNGRTRHEPTGVPSAVAA